MNTHGWFQQTIIDFQDTITAIRVFGSRVSHEDAETNRYHLFNDTAFFESDIKTGGMFTQIESNGVIDIYAAGWDYGTNTGGVRITAPGGLWANGVRIAT